MKIVCEIIDNVIYQVKNGAKYLLSKQVVAGCANSLYQATVSEQKKNSIRFIQKKTGAVQNIEFDSNIEWMDSLDNDLEFIITFAHGSFIYNIKEGTLSEIRVDERPIGKCSIEDGVLSYEQGETRGKTPIFSLLSKPAPSLYQKVMSGAKAIIDHALNNFQTVPDKVKEQRLNICRSCPFYIDEKCSQCGCYMGIKTELVSSKCPLDPPKWGPYSPSV